MSRSPALPLSSNGLASRRFQGWLWLPALALILSFSGCGKGPVDSALNSDANGFVCAKCPAKFYLPAGVFPGHCPKCKAPDVTMVIGYVCPTDQHVTIAPRSKRGGVCAKCGKSTSALSLPREADLKAWGGEKMADSDVN